MNNRLFFLLILIPLLVSCSRSKEIYHTDYYRKNSNGLNIMMKQFANNIEKIWGFDEIIIAGPKDYIKYDDNYLTRSHIDFEHGKIQIETINHNNAISDLRSFIINTFISKAKSFYKTNKQIQNLQDKPFLYGQILDDKKHPIKNLIHAKKFADFLIKKKLQYRKNSLNIILYIIVPMVPNHLNKRIHKYLPIISQASKKYGVVKSLILAIIQVESSFNQYAISQNNAIGLMQIIPNTAGIDVFRMKKKCGAPSHRYLLDPKNNIDIGTAYLSLLQNNYLAKIINPISRLYATIVAYNSGTWNLLRIFSHNKYRAFVKINSMSPKKFLYYLMIYHPSLETRKYLYKVNNAQLNFIKTNE